ncbi:hypothetical protein LUZ63_003764 [Rhynchospora breviuscula]|uniref:Uncharacterized protein n=1 Tax=Rhynchospora breviuscula TaxID=2022672 RepID=A0A9Q0D1Y4_9POAL|nr:hypothetical protein LUZ63_003764 [Rhynchospora breviuscula]
MGSGGVVVKSSMEAMLESLMRREEKPRDVPPALPPRPPSRGRLPSGRKSLPPLRFGSSEENLVFDPPLVSEDDVHVHAHAVIEEEKEKEEVEVEETKVDVVVEKEKDEKEERDSRTLKVEKELKEKEEEVAVLRQQISQFETRCSDYEAQVKWLQDQLSLQQQQQAARIQVRRKEGMNGTNHNDPVQGNKQRHHSSEDARTNPVGQLMSEFENKKKSFEEDARALGQWKPGQAASSSNPVEDLLKLKLQFTAWKRDYKVRLHETKVKLERMVGRSRRNCWAGMKWIKQ